MLNLMLNLKHYKDSVVSMESSSDVLEMELSVISNLKDKTP